MNDIAQYQLSHEFSGREKELFLLLLGNALNSDNKEVSLPLSMIFSLMPELGTEFGDRHKDILKKMMLFVRYTMDQKESDEQGFFFILSSIIIRGNNIFYSLTPMFLKKISDPLFMQFLADADFQIEK